MLNLHNLLQRILSKQIECVLVGGLAAVAHGSAALTRDLDVCFRFHPENIHRLLEALEGTHPCVRAGKGIVPLEQYEASRLAQLKNLYLKTDLGELDLLSNITGVGDYEEVQRHSIEIEIFGFTCKILDIDTLIKAKQAMNRPKDQQAIFELKAIQEKQLR